MKTRTASTLAVALALASSACAGVARIESRKAADYDRKLDRVLVVCSFDRLGYDFEDAFKTRLVAELDRRGAKARVAVIDSALAVDPGPSFAKQAKDFQASAILALIPAGGVVNQYGSVAHANFDGQLVDVARNKRVWRARIEYTPGGSAFPVETRADVLINQLVTALASDGLVRGAPPAPEPAADAASADPSL